MAKKPSHRGTARSGDQGRSVPRGRRAFTEVEHTADRAFHARGRDLKELFTHAAQAMFALEGRRSGGRRIVPRDVALVALDRETLLVNWLNELLYLQEANGETYDRFDLREISDVHLRARIHGRAHGTSRRTIKAVTFHNLEVKHGPQGWEATVVVDV